MDSSGLAVVRGMQGKLREWAVRRCASSLVGVLAMACAVLCTHRAPVAADEPTVTGAEIEASIRELGADSYTVRQAAADRLLAGGFEARAALEKVANDPDPEIRAAARRLVTLIDQSEFSRRLEEFAADVDGKRGVALPGWDKFGALVGRDQAARKLFVEMYREESPLFAEAFGDRETGHVTGILDDRILRLQNLPIPNRPRGANSSMGSWATMYFLGSLPELSMSDEAAVRMAQLGMNPPINEWLQASRGEPALRRLVSAWLVKSPSRREDVLTMQLNLMLTHELSEALPLAIGAARSDGSYPLGSPERRTLAMRLVGRLGSAKDAEALEPLLADRTEVLPRMPVQPGRQAEYSVQIRDVALATMLHLTGQELKDYGFMQVRRHPQALFDVHSLGMASDERRDAAAAQWREWKASQKKLGSLDLR